MLQWRSSSSLFCGRPLRAVQFSSVQSLDWLGHQGVHAGCCSGDPLPVFSVGGHWEQFSSVQSLDWLGHQGVHAGCCSGDPLPVFSAGGHWQQFWYKNSDANRALKRKPTVWSAAAGPALWDCFISITTLWGRSLQRQPVFVNNYVHFYLKKLPGWQYTHSFHTRFSFMSSKSLTR